MKLKQAKLYSKKSLSIFLAVVMAITTCTVAFGLNVTAATTSVMDQLAAAIQTPVVQALADKSDSSATYTGPTFNSTNTVTTSVNVQSYSDYADLVKIADLIMSEADYLVVQSNGYTSTMEYSGGVIYGENMGSIHKELSEQLEAKLGIQTYAQYSVDSLLNIVFYGWDTEFGGGVSALDYGKHIGWTKALGDYDSTTYSTLTFNLTITTDDYVGALKYSDENALSYESLKLQTKYTVTMARTSCNDGAWFGKKYLRAWVFSAASNLENAAGGTGSTTTADDAMVSAANAYKTLMETMVATYPDFATIYELSQTDSTAFAAAYDSMVAAREALIATLSQGEQDTASTYDLVDKMFANSAAYIDCFTNFEAVEDAETFGATAEAWNEFVEEKPTYGTFDPLTFDEETILADYTNFKRDYYDVLTSSTSTIYDFFVEKYNLDISYFETFGYNVEAYAVEDIKDILDAYLEQYSEIDPDTLDEDTKTLVYSALDSNLSALNNYNQEIVVASFITDEDFKVYYNLEAKFETSVNSYVAYFYDLIATDLTKLGTSDLINIFCTYTEGENTFNSEYSLKYAGLISFYNKIAACAGTETATALLSNLIAAADAVIFKGYDQLGAILESQITYAYEKYEKLGDINELQWSFALYIDLKTSIGAIESQIYDVLKELEIYETYVDETSRNEYYELLDNLIPAYEAYAATLGFDTYEDSSVEYVDREVYSTDVLKQDAYSVDETVITEIIETLDSLLTSEDIGKIFSILGLEGDSLCDVVYDLLEGMLFTDDIINAVVYMLYPLIESEFNVIELPPSVEYSGMDIGVNYKYSLDEIALRGDLAISPISLATLLTSLGYSSSYGNAIEALTLAGTNWKSGYIYDSSKGSLTIDWGVDEAIAAIEAGTYEGDETKLDIFVEAMGVALEGLYPLLGALICNQEWVTSESNIGTASTTLGFIPISLTISLDLSATGNDGYVNVLGPIFELFGYYDYADITYIANNVANASDMIKMLFTDVYGLLDYIFEAPVERIIDILPGVIYALEFDMIPQLLGMLKTVIQYSAATDLTGIVMSDTIPIDLGPTGGMLDLADMGLDTSGGVASIIDLIGIKLPNLDTATLGTLGELTTVDSNRTDSIYGLESGKAYKIDAYTEQVLYFVLDYVLGLVKNGEIYDIIKSIAGDDYDKEAIESIITSLGFGSAYVKTTDMIAAVAELFAPVQYGEVEYFTLAAIFGETKYMIKDQETGLYVEVALEYITENGITDYIIVSDSEIWDDETQSVVGKLDHLYSDYWTEDQAKFVTEDLVNYITQITTLFGLDINNALGGLVGDLLTDVFTTSTIDSILDLVNDLLGDYLTDETIAMIIDIVDEMGLVDSINVGEIVAHLQNFTYEAFENGDREAFINVIVDYIEPLTPVLKLLLVSYDDGSSLSLYAQAIEVYGYNGYESAIVPILEALGCNPEDITTYDVLITLDDEAFIKAILNPIMGILDRVESDDLFTTVLEILPNALYFIEAGGLNVAINNILQPVYAVLDAIRPIYNLSFTIDFDLVSMIDGLLKDIDLGGYVTLSFDELVSAIITLGETEEKSSVVLKTDGTAYTYNYLVISQDNYHHLVTIMIDYVSKSLTIMENEYVQEVINVLGILATLLDDKQYGELKAFLTGLASLEPSEQTAFVMYYIVYGLETGIGNIKDLLQDLLDYSGLTPEQQEQLVDLLASLILAINNFSLEDFTQSLAQTAADLQAAIEKVFGEIEDSVENTTSAFVAFFQDLFAKIKEFFDNLFKF